MAYRLTRASEQRFDVDWPANTTGILTVAMQLKLASLPVGPDPANRYGLVARADSNFFGYYSFMDSAKIVVAFHNGGYNEAPFTYTPTTSQIELVLVWDFSTATAALKAFVNGSQVGSTFTVSRGTVSSNNSSSWLGGVVISGGPPPDGTFAEVAAWNVELTADEISSLNLNSPPNVRPQNLVRYWPLIRDVNEVVTGSTITPVNGPTVADHPRIFR